MIRIFRNIRQKLAAENNFAKYLRYAVGEVILVVIGILIALQVNNWNEKRKEEEKTQLLIEQVYSAIKRDNDALNSNIIFYNDQLKDCDILNKRADSLSDQELVEMLYYLDTTPIDIFEADKFAGELNFDNISKEHIHLIAQIKNFLNGNVYKQSLPRSDHKKELIRPILIKNGISEIISTFGYSSYFNFNQYQGQFSNNELKTTRQLNNSNLFRSPIKSVISSIMSRIESSNNIIADGNYLLGEIIKKFPKLRLMYDNAGIIGSALPSGYRESVPMKLKDEYKSIWEINIKLSEGDIKFRTRNSWTQNWGGVSFPKGYAQYYGRDIHVDEAGFYHIELNLSNNIYEFNKINNNQKNN